jgi:hypothetical protein
VRLHQHRCINKRQRELQPKEQMDAVDEAGAVAEEVAEGSRIDRSPLVPHCHISNSLAMVRQLLRLLQMAVPIVAAAEEAGVVVADEAVADMLTNDTSRFGSTVPRPQAAKYRGAALLETTIVPAAAVVGAAEVVEAVDVAERSAAEPLWHPGHSIRLQRNSFLPAPLWLQLPRRHHRHRAHSQIPAEHSNNSTSSSLAVRARSSSQRRLLRPRRPRSKPSWTTRTTPATFPPLPSRPNCACFPSVTTRVSARASIVPRCC